jgi:hypothetical protein
MYYQLVDLKPRTFNNNKKYLLEGPRRIKFEYRRFGWTEMKSNQNCVENIYGYVCAESMGMEGPKKRLVHSIIFCRIQSKILQVLKVICYEWFQCGILQWCCLITLPQKCTYVLGGLGKALGIGGLEMFAGEMLLYLFLFILFFHQQGHSYIHLFVSDTETPGISLSLSFSLRKTSLGCRDWIPGPALEQASALPTQLRCTRTDL